MLAFLHRPGVNVTDPQTTDEVNRLIRDVREAAFAAGQKLAGPGHRDYRRLQRAERKLRDYIAGRAA